MLSFLIDTGANKNFIAPHVPQKTTKLAQPFIVNSAAGNLRITEKVTGRFFEKLGNRMFLTFYVLPGLKSFDGIIGDDSLKELEAIIDRKENVLSLSKSIKLPLKNKISEEINALLDESLPKKIKSELTNLIKKYSVVFGPLSANEMVRTTVRAEIRTSTDEPIYRKSYPYPPCMREEVEKEIKALLTEGIIRPSKSPYNSPIWMVSKKPKPNGELQYRMVIDYKRLNAVTISDAYPIPDINSTLASLGQAKYFTTLDLTSGFHQIPMKESDIPKTAFSTLNGKYEWLRLPFGLKNAPAIFQRMIDDVLKEFIGKLCYVYIDDIVIFGKDIDETMKNIETILSRLQEANLKVNLEKTQFLKTEVEFLGYVITPEGIRTDPKKVEAIQKLLPPENLKELKSFLGLTSYYRKFIRDYAKIAKPLTNLTRGENAQIKANQSRRVPIELDEKALQAFDDLKNLLTSAEVLAFPDFKKAFNLTTDASDYAIGAVLSQDISGQDKPIAYISRSLNKTEESYATNEKEMLAIVWALDNLRSYVYGAKKIRIHTDHQPLTYTMGNRNFNAKLKRWKARIEEYNYELIYKPGKSNLVADALSRLKTQVNHLPSSAQAETVQSSKRAHYGSTTETASNSSTDTVTNLSESDSLTETASESDGSTNTADETVHSAVQDASDLIPHVEAPLNVFRNQIIINVAKDFEAYEEPHPGYSRYHFSVEYLDKDALTAILKARLQPNIINGIKIPELCMELLQKVYLETFANYKIRITQRLVEDIKDEDKIWDLISKEHRRAHRNARENKEQLLEKYYFPRMNSLITRYAKSCEVCMANKYDRHPVNPEFRPTPIPSYPCEILHMDIMELQNEKYISCIDKFSKFSKLFHIKNKSSLYLRNKITKILHYFTVPRMLVTDNERSFLSPIILNFIKMLGIELYRTPVHRSEVNGQVERFHSTVLEIFRCLKAEYKDLKTKELLSIAVDRYNNTIHSVTKKKPSDIFFNRSSRINYQGLVNYRAKINHELRGAIEKKQKANNKFRNAKRSSPKKYKKGEVIYTAYKKIQGKNKPLFRKEFVAKDNKVTVITSTGRKVHKAHIKNIDRK